MDRGITPVTAWCVTMVRKISSVCKEQLVKRMILLIAAVLLCPPNRATAQQEPELGVTFELSYWTKWLSKGAEAYGQKGAL